MSHSNDRLFTATEITEYLSRIGLEREKIDGLSPSERLKTLHLHHLLNIPFDTTSIHLPAKWWATEESSAESLPVTLNGHKNNTTKPELISVDCDLAFNNIIRERRGGYCWSLNSSFARLLLSLGYRVSQLPARVFSYRNQNPQETGYAWTPQCHACLLVDTGESGSFICDVGFGGGSSAYPVPFEENLEIHTLTAGEKFRIVNEECLNLDVSSTDPGKGFTVQRWCGKWWSPCYHFYLSPIVFKDLEVYNWYTTCHHEAHFVTRLAVTILRKDGSRRTLYCERDKDGHQTAIKLHTREHTTAQESHVSVVTPTYAELFKTLKHEFGWGPPSPSAS